MEVSAPHCWGLMNIFVRNFSKNYLAKGIHFYLHWQRQRLPALAVFLSIICKSNCLHSNDYYGYQTIQPECCNSSQVWIRNFTEHAIKQKTMLQLNIKRFHSTSRTFWERGKNLPLAPTSGTSIPCHAANWHWFPTTACDFHRLITRAWTLYVPGTWISSPLFSPAETSSFNM